MARGRRRETFWMTTPSPLVLIATTRVTATNTGNSAQNCSVGRTSSPGQALTSGRAIHGASSTRCASYRPARAAAALPTVMPINGAHSRQTPDARIARAALVASVTPATARPAPSDSPSLTSVSRLNATGMTVRAISISEVPATTGVMIRRSRGSQAARAN